MITTTLLSRIKDIPTIPTVAMRLMRADEDTNVSEIVGIISKDQSIASKILQMANSAYYRAVNKVSTVQQAIVLIGFRELRKIATFAFMKNHFDADIAEDSKFDRLMFWKHTVYVSLLSDALGEFCRVPERNDLFLGGLFHDIGRVIMDKYFHEDFVKLSLLCKSPGSDILEMEKQVFGMAHNNVGYEVLRNWQIPRSICSSTKFHHEPWKDQLYGKMSAVIFITNTFCGSNNFMACSFCQPIISWESFLASEYKDRVATILEVNMAELETLLTKRWELIKDISFGFI